MDRMPSTWGWAALCISLVPVMGTRVRAEDKTWDGECGDMNWQCDENWDADGVPGASDNVIVAEDDGVIEIPCCGSAHVSQANIFSGLTIRTPGNVTFDGASQIANLVAGESATARLFANATVILSGDSFASGLLDGGGTFANIETMSVGGTAFNTLENHGTMTVLSEDLTLDDGALLKNFGTLEIPGIADIKNGGSGVNTLESGGTVQKVSAGLSTISPKFVQTGGSLDVQAGTLRINGALTLGGGTVSISDGATLDISGNAGPIREFNGVTNISGAGTMELNAPITISNELQSSLAGGLIVGRDLTLDFTTFTNSGRLAMDGAGLVGPGTLRNEPGGTIETLATPIVFGAVVHNKGTIQQDRDITVGSGIFLNQNGGTWNINGGGVVAAGGTIVNAGTLDVDFPGGGVCNINAPLNLNAPGTVAVRGNTTLQVRGGGESSYTNVLLANENAAIVVRDELFRAGGSIFGPGIARINGIGENPILKLISSIQFQAKCELNGGTVLGPGQLHQLTHALYLNGASIGVDLVVVNDAGVYIENATKIYGILQNDGVCHHNGGTVSLYIGSAVINRKTYDAHGGAIVAAESGSMFHNAPGKFQSNTEPGQFVVDVPFNNTGLVLARGANIVFQDAADNIQQISGGAITGGRWETDGSGGKIVFEDFTLQSVGPEAELKGDEDSLPILQDLRENDGKITLTGPVTISHNDGIDNVDGAIINQDKLDTNGGPISNGLTADLQGITVLTLTLDGAGFNAGYFASVIENHGQVTPGGTGAASGFLLTGDYVQHATGRLNIELAGLTPINEHDQLLVDGDVTLSGALRLAPLEGYQPNVGDSFEVVSVVNGSLAGMFDETVGPFGATVSYSTTAATVVITQLAGDGDADGDVDLDDYASFNACVSGKGGGVDPGCEPFDFDADGDVDLLDWSGLQQRLAPLEES